MLQNLHVIHTYSFFFDQIYSLQVRKIFLVRRQDSFQDEYIKPSIVKKLGNLIHHSVIQCYNTLVPLSSTPLCCSVGKGPFMDTHITNTI